MNLYEIIYGNEYTSDRAIKNIEISSISTSPDNIDSKTLFVFIKSINFDITKIISYIIAKKPAAIICDKDINIHSKDIPILKSDNARRLLPFLYSRFHRIDYSKMFFMAITGTNGKTSTATMLYHILREAGLSVGFIGTGKIIIDGKQINDINYSMTTPDPILLYSVIKKMEDYGCRAVVMEVSSHALYFDKVAPIPFKVSVFTNLSPEHMDFHNDMESYFQSKLKLFSQSQIGIFNTDDYYSTRALKESKCIKRSIGIINNADVSARDISQNGLRGSEYIFFETNRLFKVKLKIGGSYNIYNSMLAIKAALEVGIKPYIAKNAISKLDFIEGRLEIICETPTVIIDYAHTSDALLNILKLINSTKTLEQKLILVFGCGGERDKTKRPKMAETAEKNSDFVIVTTDNSRNESELNIIKDIIKGFSNKKNYKIIPSRKEAIEYAIINADTSDIVLIAGKGHERYNIDKNGYHIFDERDIIWNTLKLRKDYKDILYENHPIRSSDIK